MSLYEYFSKESPATSNTEPFTASKGWAHTLRNRFGLKNTKITGEAASAGKEAAAMFPTGLEKLTGVSYSPRFQISTRVLGTYPLQGIAALSNSGNPEAPM